MPLSSRTLFIIDDDRDDLDFFSEAIAVIDPTIKCVIALNGLGALHILNTWPGQLPDAIFMDLNLPLMDGKKCLTEIKKIRSLISTPVVIYSTSSRQKDIDETAALGAAHFITKPSSLKELVKELQFVLSLSDMKKASAPSEKKGGQIPVISS